MNILEKGFSVKSLVRGSSLSINHSCVFWQPCAKTEKIIFQVEWEGNQDVSLPIYCTLDLITFFLSFICPSRLANTFLPFGSMLTWLSVFPAVLHVSQPSGPPATDGLLYPQWWHPAPFSVCQVVSEETQNGQWLTTIFSSYSLPVNFPFFHRNGANVQPCGQLTGRLGPYANFMMAEPIVSSAHWRNDVLFGSALILTLIYSELLMLNRVRVCF